MENCVSTRMANMRGRTLLALAFTVASVFAEGITGRWTGTFRPSDAQQDGPALLILKQDGEKVTGSAGPNENERFDIEDGKVVDGKLTFTVRNGGMKFALSVKDDQISGDVTRDQDGETQRAKLDVKREK